MKKRKKRRSKTEGGDKLPFDAEMGKNQKTIKVLQRLFDAGYGTEKEITIHTTTTDKETGEKVREETKGADYGGTT